MVVQCEERTMFLALTRREQRLLREAREALESAYAPHVQRMHVGAAVLTRTGRIIPGSNMEMAAVTSGLCAERCAIAAAHSERVGDQLVAIAVVARRISGPTTKPEYPCPECRGAIWESASRSGVEEDFKIILATPDFESAGVIVTTIGELYPWPFRGSRSQ